MVFDNEKTPPASLACKAASLASDIDKAYGDGCSHTINALPPRQVAWLGTPNKDTIAINVDGSSMPLPGFGGLVRDHCGTFIFGFYGSAGQATVLQAEILGILHGLRLCRDHGFNKARCYSDSLNAVRLINEGVTQFDPLANEVQIVRHILREFM